MKIKWLTIVAILFACIGAGFFLYAGKNSNTQSAYSLLNPALTEEQKAVVQPQIDQQLARKTGGAQVSSTQVAYDNGAVLITFPVPGASNEPATTCDYGYFCVWEHPDYLGRKLAIVSDPKKPPVNLSDYNMSLQVSSWKYNNKPYATIVYGVDNTNGRGAVMACTLKEIDDWGGECCPFNVSEKTQAWTENYSTSHLQSRGDRIVSVLVSPLGWGEKVSDHQEGVQR